LVVDDHELVRRSVRLLLGSDQRWKVCGEASTAEEAIEKTLALTPDVVILDLSLPAVGGLDVASAIRHAAPSTKIIFFSMMENSLGSQIAQGDTFVAKGTAATDLPRALEQILAKAQ
jgi:two-component system invasion response regulator UvrY